jgi:hypothetical protein
LPNLGFFLEQLLHLLLLAALAWGCGVAVVLRLDVRGCLAHGLAAALGLLLLAQLSFALGLVGLLVAPAWGGLATLGAGLGALGWWRSRRAAPGRGSADRGAWGASARTAGVPLTPAIGILLLGAPWFLTALYPPHAFDELTYHLPFARAFADTASLPFLPELRFPVFPVLADTLFAAGLLLADDLASHLVSLLATVLTAALAAGWAARRAGEGGQRTFSGWVAGALVLGNPVAIYLGSTAYVEPLLGLATLIALFALDQGGRTLPQHGDGDRSEATEEARWLTVAALAAGSAAAIKYSGLLVLAVVGTVALLRCRRRAGRWRALGLAALVALAAAGPTYWRQTWFTGNPLFPFYPEVFGWSPWEPPLEPRSDAELWRGRLTVLGDAVLRRERSGGHPPLGPVWGLAVPAALFAALRMPRWRASAGGAVATWAVLPPDIRYLTALLPLLAAPAAILLGQGAQRLLAASAWTSPHGCGPRGRERGEGHPEQHLAVGLVLLLLAPGPAYAGYRLLRSGMPPTDFASARRTWIERQVPLSALLFAWEDRRAAGSPPERLYVYGAETLRGLAAEVVLGEELGPANYWWLRPRFADAEALATALRRAGAHELLIGHPLPASTRTLDCRLVTVEGAVFAVPRRGRQGQPCPALQKPRTEISLPGLGTLPAQAATREAR